MRASRCLLAFVFLGIASAAAAAEATVIVDVRDSATGRAVDAAGGEMRSLLRECPVCRPTSAGPT